MRHGYYLVYTDKLYGDQIYSEGLREIYLSFNLTKPGFYDGVSRFDDLITGKIRTVILLRNLFPKDEKDSVKPVMFDL